MLVNQPQDQVCLEAVTVVVTWPSPIYVDTQPYRAQPYTWTPTPTQPTPILSIQRPAHSAPALSLRLLMAKGLNCLRLVIKMIMAVVMIMAMITIIMTSIIT